MKRGNDYSTITWRIHKKYKEPLAKIADLENRSVANFVETVMTSVMKYSDALNRIRNDRMHESGFEYSYTMLIEHALVEYVRRYDETERRKGEMEHGGEI